MKNLKLLFVSTLTTLFLIFSLPSFADDTNEGACYVIVWETSESQPTEPSGCLENLTREQCTNNTFMWHAWKPSQRALVHHWNANEACDGYDSLIMQQ